MVGKICTMFKIEKLIKIFHKSYTECKKLDSIGSLRRYYENKDKYSNQRKLKFEKTKNRILQKRNDR